MKKWSELKRERLSEEQILKIERKVEKIMSERRLSLRELADILDVVSNQSNSWWINDEQALNFGDLDDFSPDQIGAILNMGAEKDEFQNCFYISDWKN